MADQLRSRPSRLLLWAALAMCLALGAAVVITGLGERPLRPAATITDDEAAAQVVTAARRVIATARLQHPAGGYAFMPCGAEEGPPYQAVLHMTFTVPQRNSAGYLDGIAAALVDDGWVRSGAEGDHFGITLTRSGMTALLTHETRQAGSATMKLYGECRVDGDHSDDDPAWTDVTL
ncbi:MULTISPECIES: hypothetical protein [unclassified Mycobacterium]|uniref:hypothetical protein n=1 Tax=unclassified Mycobacterium TaxID=2642494 RepID=UPI0007FCC5E8|nr:MULTISPECIES: hypothetical protein [unclassified Mycobacterium]OBB46628.1 hypothetical protein A5752_01805 [Mycobacterium sp. 852002-51961_SCH5331710]OBG85938.1 hypothetical protein A5698_03260 [Mycobacterium sp. E136]